MFPVKQNFYSISIFCCESIKTAGPSVSLSQKLKITSSVSSNLQNSFDRRTAIGDKTINEINKANGKRGFWH